MDVKTVFPEREVTKERLRVLLEDDDFKKLHQAWEDRGEGYDPQIQELLKLLYKKGYRAIEIHAADTVACGLFSM